jgi:hypothetical protein
MSPPDPGYKPAKLIQGRYVAYHRMRMEIKLGRRLRAGECVAFKDGDQNNLLLNNLLLTDRTGLGALRRRAKNDRRCKRCRKSFHVSPSAKKNGSGNYCSWECRYPK